MANEITIKLIANITRISTGPNYEEAVELGTRYWETVLAGPPDPAAKEAADKALSRLMGCRAKLSGRKYTWKDKILWALNMKKKELALRRPVDLQSGFSMSWVPAYDLSAAHLDCQIDSSNASDNTQYCNEIHQCYNAQQGMAEDQQPEYYVYNSCDGRSPSFLQCPEEP